MTQGKILIIDDDADVRAGLTIRLQSNGYTVAHAEDAVSAMTAVRRENPDLIILDVGLPGGDGFAVLDRLRFVSDRPWTPVVMLSAQAAATHSQRAVDAGASVFLEKPFDDQELMAVIQKYMPRHEDDEGHDESQPASSPAPRKILVVDDDPDVLRALNVRLRSRGYEVVVATDGFSVISVAQQEHPDLILLDLGLPGSDGFTVMERLRNIGPLACIPVIVLSARDALTECDRALAAGALSYLQKPIDDAALLTAIESVLDPHTV